MAKLFTNLKWYLSIIHRWKSKKDSATSCIVGLFGVGMNFRPLLRTALCVFVNDISLRLTTKSGGCCVFAICLLSFLMYAS